MHNYLMRWLFAPSKWWQFWKPQSGAQGGLLFGLLLAALLALIALTITP